MSPHGVPFRNWLTSQVTAFVIQNDNKKPTEIHLTPDLERRLVADHREEMGRNLPAGFKDADINSDSEPYHLGTLLYRSWSVAGWSSPSPALIDEARNLLGSTLFLLQADGLR